MHRLSIHSDRPRQVRWSAVGFGVEIVSPPADRLSQRNRWRRQVQQIQRTDFPVQTQQSRDAKSRDQAAMNGQPSTPDIDNVPRLCKELNIPVGISYVHTNWVVSISTWLEELRWKPTYTIQTGIGQGVMLITPISLATYGATLANRGTVYKTTIMDHVTDPDGKLVKKNETVIVDSVYAPEEFWDAIIEGMEGVVSPEDGGTAASSFSTKFRDKGYLDQIIGKTGTAQTSVTSSTNIDIENTAWFIAATPREKPEIVIVVFIPNGLSGSSNATAVEEIVSYWLENRKETA